jgi:hypothetical protein
MKSKNILDHYNDLTDPREDNKRHLLIDSIAIVICASICSAESWEDIVIFGQAKETWLRTFLTLPHGIPSKDTFLPADGKTVGAAIRSHWGIENSLHWSLDMAFREDECRKRKDNSAENFALLRHITLNLLKQEKTCKRNSAGSSRLPIVGIRCIAGKRLLAGWDTNYLEKVLFQGK